MAKKIKKPGKIRKSFGWAFKPFVNVTGWLGYSSVKDGYSNVKNTANDLFASIEAEHDESFEEAVERLGLDQTALNQQYKNFRSMFILCICIASLLLLLSLYWIFSGGFFGGFIAFILMLIGLTNAFRYNFWMFQIKQKKLGCTINEWFQLTFKIKK